jgi:hypothetical protein
MGGLGNIMFIVSNIYSLSIDRHDKYCVSDNTQSCTKRPQESVWLKTIFKDVKKVQGRPKYIRKMFREKGFSHQVIPNTDHFEIHGYFQSAKYFDHNRSHIVKLFTTYKKQIQTKLDKIFPKTDKETVSIHIRRGDYVRLAEFHHVQKIEYYQKALSHFQDKDYHFIIFSDDIEWCQETDLFNQIEDKTFITKTTDVQDLYLMSMCNHNIIANSSFSWWGSYLNENDTKKVVAPKIWFGPKGPQDWQDIYMENWILE